MNSRQLRLVDCMVSFADLLPADNRGANRDAIR
jgi:hypothetical protein